MDEILYELREHSRGPQLRALGLHLQLHQEVPRAGPTFVLPDRGAGDDDRSRSCASYTQLLVKTCHRRGAHAMGGMAAQIPIKERPRRRTRRRSRRCARTSCARSSDGHDGTWVAHPGLVPVARESSTSTMPGPNQLDRAARGRARRRARPARRRSTRARTPRRGSATTSASGVQLPRGWLRGGGCVPIYNLMEDAATAEISRAQVWQWIRHGATLDDGARSRRAVPR